MKEKHIKQVIIKYINKDLWDTAGQECFQTLHASYYYGANACILVYIININSVLMLLEKLLIQI